MKKFISFSFVFVLSLILLGFNANSASAANCAPGDLFSSVTGQACGNTSAVVVCSLGDLFSSVTGQRCTTFNEIDDSQDSTSLITQFNNLYKSYFRIGLRGDSNVRALQQFLQNEGYYSGRIDGSYGRITDRAVNHFRDDYSVTNTQTSNLLLITPSNLPNATVGQYYSTNLSAIGGTGSYGWNTGSNVLPSGLSFTITTCPTSGSCNPTTSIIGTPTISGTYTFTLTVTSGSQSVSNQFTLIVDSAVTSASLTAAISSSFNGQAISGGMSNVKIGSFTLSAGLTEDVNVTKVNVSLDSYSSVQNLTLKDSSTGIIIDVIQAIPSMNNGFYPPSGTLIVPASGTKTIDIYADIRSGSLGVIQTSVSIVGASLVTANLVSTSLMPLQIITVGTATTPTTCSNNATNPPTCSINNNGYCINNATNPPSCTSCPHSFVRVAGSCVVNVCANGTINPPACTLTSTQQTANYTAWLNDIYQNYLGRATDPVGLNFYLPRLLSLSTETEDKITAEKNQIKIEIAGSQEAGYYTFLKGVYWTELGREFTNNNDADGLKFYIDQLLAGKSKEQVQAEIHASPEAVQYRAAHTIVVPASTEQTVWLTNVYQVYLGRTPDTAGLNYYLDLLNSGAKTQDQVKAEIVASKEATQYIFLKNVYQTELGRDFTNDANGLAYYMNRLLSATNLQQEQLQIKAEIHASSEAVLYRAANVLGVETFHFTQFLDEGTSGNEVRELQKFLNTAGYNAGNVDGVFGAKVKEALIKFQIANGLKVDGFVGYEVRTFLNR